MILPFVTVSVMAMALNASMGFFNTTSTITTPTPTSPEVLPFLTPSYNWTLPHITGNGPLACLVFPCSSTTTTTTSPLSTPVETPTPTLTTSPSPTNTAAAGTGTTTTPRRPLLKTHEIFIIAVACLVPVLAGCVAIWLNCRRRNKKSKTSAGVRPSDRFPVDLEQGGIGIRVRDYMRGPSRPPRRDDGFELQTVYGGRPEGMNV